MPQGDFLSLGLSWMWGLALVCEAPTQASVMKWGHFLVLISQEELILGQQADPRGERESLPPHSQLFTLLLPPHALLTQLNQHHASSAGIPLGSGMRKRRGKKRNHSWFVGKIETNRIRQNTGSRQADGGRGGREQTSGKRRKICEDQRGQVLSEQSSDPPLQVSHPYVKASGTRAGLSPVSL